MFDLGWTELLIIGVVALIVVGPKDLPKMFRTLGQFTAKARNLAREFQRAMDAAADESGVKDIARDLRNTASGRDIKDAMGFDELDKEMRAMGRPDQWGKSPSPKPGKTAATKAKPDPAAPPPDGEEAAVAADDSDQAGRAAHAAAMDEERRKRAERAAEARARAAEIRARREPQAAAPPAKSSGATRKATAGKSRGAAAPAAETPAPDADR
jgi:sec-independent protein translocase protein TatB